MDFLVVDLYETASDQMFLISLRIRQGNYLVKGSRNDTFRLLTFGAAHHSVSLAATGLPICENSSVISFKHIIDQGKCSLFIDIALQGINSKYTIEAEGFGWLWGIGLEQFDLIG